MEQLNKIYCAQSHLRERLSELLDNNDFLDLRPVIAATVQEMDTEVASTEQVYLLMGRKYSFEKCTNLLSVLEDDFNQVQLTAHDIKLRDLALLTYMQNIQHIAISAFQRIQLGHSKLAGYVKEITNIASLLPGELLKQLLLDRLHAASK